MNRTGVTPMQLVLFAIVFLAGCGRDYEAALVLAEIAGFEVPAVLGVRAPDPRREPVDYRVNGREYRGDLYRSAVPAQAGIVLLPGAAERGKDDPRLVAFATTLARARFAVLVPNLDGLRRMKVGTGNIREIADAFAWLVSRSDLAPSGRAGIFAFSYTAGPAFLAAMEEDIRHRTRFVFSVGGYHNLESVITFFTTGCYRHEGEWRFMEPNRYGAWVFILNNIERLRDPTDREVLREMALRRMEDSESGIDDLVQRLGDEGRSVYGLISNRDPASALALISRLPNSIRADIEALTLADKPLERLEARAIIVHGLDDDIIPYTESIALAKAMPPGQSRLFLARGLFHVDVRPGPLDSWRLWRAVSALLGEREAEPNLAARP